MNNQFIRGITFDWEKIDPNSYLRGIKVLQGVEEIMLSHSVTFFVGESFLALAQDTLGVNGLYLFDEPEAALSPQRQLTLLAEIDRAAKEGAQFIIVTHSPILLGLPDAEILCFDNGRIHPCAYEETDSYQVTELFINHRGTLLKQLLED